MAKYKSKDFLWVVHFYFYLPAKEVVGECGEERVAALRRLDHWTRAAEDVVFRCGPVLFGLVNLGWVC